MPVFSLKQELLIVEGMKELQCPRAKHPFCSSTRFRYEDPLTARVVQDCHDNSQFTKVSLVLLNSVAKHKCLSHSTCTLFLTY